MGAVAAKNKNNNYETYQTHVVKLGYMDRRFRFREITYFSLKKVHVSCNYIPCSLVCITIVEKSFYCSFSYLLGPGVA